MEIEYLKKLSERLASVTAEDFSKAVVDVNLENPAVLLGCVLILISFSAVGIYVFLSFLSLFSQKKRLAATEDSTVYQLNSRISSLEMIIAEQKNFIKHLSQKISADRLTTKAEIGRIKADVKELILEELRIQEYKNVA